MKVLHLVRELGDDRAISTLLRQCEEGHEITVVLLHDAVLDQLKEEGCRVLACEDDVRARGGRAGWPTVDYEGVVRLLFEADRVICW
ncbi:MAG: hypothetical protein AB1603_08415 [Chloroflexota bacterium]